MADHKPDGSLVQTARPAEITVAAVVLGVTLSIVMGAANVYLGLRAGMTVSASIPAAVISIGILRGILRRSSILESNMVQTAASAGESLAAGIIFTMPALLLTGVWEDFHFWTTTLIALAGGLLGILMMIPMRKVFVVDNEDLKFPEGVACAEVLRAGSDGTAEGVDAGNSGLGLIVGGILVGGVFKVLQSFVGLFRSSAEVALAAGGRVFYFGADISPALFSVGYIVTLPIAASNLCRRRAGLANRNTLAWHRRRNQYRTGGRCIRTLEYQSPLPGRGCDDRRWSGVYLESAWWTESSSPAHLGNGQSEGIGK